MQARARAEPQAGVDFTGVRAAGLLAVADEWARLGMCAGQSVGVEDVPAKRFYCEERGMHK